MPQASPEVSPYDAKNDTSLAGAWRPNCQLQQIAGHCAPTNTPPLLLLTPEARWDLPQNAIFPDM